MVVELESLEIKIQAQATNASGEIDKLVTRLGKLSNSLQSIDGSGLNRLSTGVSRLSTAMLSMNAIDSRSFSAAARNVTKLAEIDSGKLSAAADSMRRIAGSLKGFDKLSSSVKGLTELAGGIKQLGYTSSTKAIENIPKLATAMRQLMAELSQAPRVSQNLIDMTNSLAKLARTGGAAGTAARSLTSSFDSFGNGASRVKSSSFSLASAIGKVYATYWMLFRAFGKIKDAIDISSSLTEVENVVRTTFGKYESLVNDFAANSIQKFGMSELSVKQFASRFQAMGVAMGFPQGKMADMSVQLTKLTADMASFYDVEQSAVAEDLAAIFTGQTRPLRDYGLDLTQATLKEWALNNGMEANFKTMTQTEKAMLRYQYVMANTAAAQGDFSKTADTWHNRVTVLKQSFQQLAGIIGGALINAFKPFVRTLNTVLQKVIQFATMVTDALGSIFGWKYEASDVGITDDLSDSYEDVAGAANDAANGTKKAAKEAKKSARVFDELKIISSSKNNGSSGSGSGSGGGSGSSGGGKTGKLVQTEPIYKDFESNINNLRDLGKSISGALIDAMKGIDWDSIYAKAEGFGTGLASFLNGLFEGQKGTTLFGEVGRSIANSLNTVLHALDSFGETFDWTQFGNSIADGVNKFFKNFDFALLATTINTWVNGLWTTVKSFLSNLSYKDIFDGLSEFLRGLSTESVATILGAAAISRYGETLGKCLKKSVNKWFKKNGIKISVTDAMLAIGTMFVTFTVLKFLDENDIPSKIIAWFKDIPNKIKFKSSVMGFDGKKVTVSIPIKAAFDNITFKIKHIKWKDILDNVFNFDETSGFFDEMKKNFQTAFDGKREDIMDMGSYIFEGIMDGFTGAFSGLLEPFKDFFTWVSDGIKDAFGIHSPAKKMKPIGKNIFLGIIEGWKEKIASFSFVKYAKKLMSKIQDGFDSVKDKAVEFKAAVKNEAKKWWQNTKDYWSEKVGTVKEFTTSVKNQAKAWWGNTKSWWGEKVGKVSDFTTGVKNKASEWWSNVKTWWKNTIAGKEVSKFTANVKKTGGTWWSDVKSAWNESTAGKKLTVAVDFAKNALSNMWTSVTQFFSGKTINVGTKATKKADGGVFYGGSWHSIKKYAAGGAPNFGQMFIAREAGPELVGNLGGHTAVMNNDQIVSSVANGVAQATERVLRSYIRSNGNSGQPIQIVLDGKVIFDSTRKSAQEFFNKTGTAPYPV